MKYKMEQLINRSNTALRKRGVISDKTNLADYILKMGEELKEIEFSYFKESNIKTLNEITQLMTVCIMALLNSGLNPIEEFKKEVEKNEHRAKKATNKLEK